MNFKYFFTLSVFSFFAYSVGMGQTHSENLIHVKAEADALKQIAVLNTTSFKIPIVKLTDLKIASVDLGFPYASVFDSIANKYTSVITLPAIYNSESQKSINDLNDDLKLYTCAILKTSKPLTKNLISLIKELEKTKQIILVYAGPSNKTDFSSFQSPV